LRLSPPPSPSRSRSNSNESNQSAQVDWEELEKTEEHQPKEEGSDDVCPHTSLLGAMDEADICSQWPCF
jgi:hypothetical protein